MPVPVKCARASAAISRGRRSDGYHLTKLDGTAKGGIIFALAEQLKLPIRFIGLGEGIDDLKPFDANDFVMALFDEQEGIDERQADPVLPGK